MDHGGRTYLQALGHHPVLRRCDGSVAVELQRKDLALLAYLAIEGDRPHARGRLAALLWGESPEALARHSLTQSLRRVRRAAGPGAVEVRKESVRWTDAVPCDAALLLAGEPHPLLDDELAVYAGPFLEGFEAGFGSEEFEKWADGRRADLRDAALRWLEERGARAEAEGDWERALRLGERAVAIDPLAEQGRRRVMRALAARGERNRALRCYEAYAAWLAEEVVAEPDPDTRALAERLRAAEAVDPPREAPRPAPPASAAKPSARTPSALDLPAAPSPAPAAIPAPAAAAPARAPETASPAPAAVPPAPAVEGSGWRHGGLRAAAVKMAVATGALFWLWTSGGIPRPAEPPPRYGESIRAAKGGPVYLVWSGVLWEYPDRATLERCLGGWTARVRVVRRLPAWPRRRLASVLAHPWQGGADAVVTDHPAISTQYVAVGCVLAPIPDPLTFRTIFGHTDWERSHVAADSLLRASPRTVIADPYPVRRPGTLIQGANDSIRWIVFHGGALDVPPRVLDGYCRSLREVVRVPDAEFRYYRAWAPLPPAAVPCRARAAAARPPPPRRTPGTSVPCGRGKESRRDGLSSRRRSARPVLAALLGAGREIGILR